jgi:hypothetical protein
MYIEVIGIIGGLCFLIAFLETAIGRWNGHSFYYEAFNLAGAVLLGYYAFSKDAYTNIVLNLVWGVVALYSLNNIIVRHQQRKEKKLQRAKTKSRRKRT